MLRFVLSKREICANLQGNADEKQDRELAKKKGLPGLVLGIKLWV